MTLGRPTSIPDKFIKLEFPRSLPAPNAANYTTDEHSVQFYTATM